MNQFNIFSIWACLKRCSFGYFWVIRRYDTCYFLTVFGRFLALHRRIVNRDFWGKKKNHSDTTSVVIYKYYYYILRILVFQWSRTRAKYCDWPKSADPRWEPIYVSGQMEFRRPSANASQSAYTVSSTSITIRVGNVMRVELMKSKKKFANVCIRIYYIY